MNQQSAPSEKERSGGEHINVISRHKATRPRKQRHDHAEHEEQKALTAHDELWANQTSVYRDRSQLFFHDGMSAD